MNKKISNILLAVIICANSICWQFNGISNILAYIVLMSVAGIILLQQNKFTNIKIGLLLFVLFVIVLFFLNFVVSFIIKPIAYSKIFKEFIYFICLGVSVIIIAQCCFDYYLVLRYILLLSLVLLPYVYRIEFGVEGYDAVDYGMWMSISYGILPYLNANITLLFFDKSRILRVLAALSILAYLPKFILYGSRGSILSFLLCIIICFLLKKNFSLRQIFIKTIKWCALLILFSPLVYNFLKFIVTEYNIFFLRKIVYASGIVEAMNGRDVLYVSALQGFISSPLYGKGIASFDNYSGIYPHNIFLQVLYEGGIIFAVPLFYLILRSVNLIFKRTIEYDKRIFVLYLFVTSLVNLLFSSNFWRHQIFWLLIGLILSLKRRNRETYYNYQGSTRVSSSNH
jgi:hypothetical protein